MNKSTYLLAAAVGLVALVDFAMTQDLGPNIFIRINNPHQDARGVQVIDHICDRIALDHPLSSQSTTEVELCTRMGRGEISVIDLPSGRRKHTEKCLVACGLRCPNRLRGEHDLERSAAKRDRYALSLG